MATAQQLQVETLYPWKSKSGLIGYSNQDGQLKIQPQFENASLFTNQFAVIEKDGYKGVISRDGSITLDYQYEEVQLVAVGDETLAISRRKYNAWWKVNQWKLFPGFSIMGGTNDKRLFDTEVNRMKWEVILLSNKQTFISSSYRPNEYLYDTSNIRYFNHKILINDQLYLINKGHVKQLSGVFKGILTDSTLLRKNGNSYQIIGSDLKPQGNAIFKVPEQIIVKVGENIQELKTANMISGVKVKFDFMEDQHAHIFIYPDLKKIFPEQIDKYLDNKTDATDIIRNAQMICSVPNTDYFLIYSTINDRKGFYILNQNGSWESDITRTKDFIIRSNSGNLLYPSIHDLGIDAFLPKNFAVRRIERTMSNKNWFSVSGMSNPKALPLSGIFDSANKRWVLP
ncbi:MAG: WG repeat-containing protein, partial [Pedobacter sp.]|nr:WG repeat-containing protein [Pedobacter sp.]